MEGSSSDAALAGYTGTFDLELLGPDGFVILPSPKLSKPAYAAMRRWPGAMLEDKRLRFEAKAYKMVTQRLAQRHKVNLPANWVLASLANFRAHGQVELRKKVAHVLLANAAGPEKDLPDSAASREGNPVLPYQREAVNFALRRGGRVLLADEMGLGKTAQALTLASQYPQDWPLLVVCPSSLRGNWREEAGRWLPQDLLPDPERHVQVIWKGADTTSKAAKVVIVSYDLLARNVSFTVTATGKDYRMVICDEAHYLKNPEAQRTSALRPLVQKARRCALLTGTPALAKASELYSPLDCLLPGFLPSYVEFCERYTMKKNIQVGRKQVVRWEGTRHGDELNAILDTVMVRRFKKDVLSQLPEKRRQRVVLDKLGGGKEVQKELKEKMKDFAGKQSLEEVVDSSNGSAPELFRLTGLAKADAVAEYVEYLVLADCRFLLFAHHKDVMDTLQKKLEQLKTRHIRIDGSTLPKRREELVAEFRAKPELQVALLSITACGVGLNLQVCSTVVFAELHWTPGVLTQAEDRAHRMGQKHSVNVHYLIAKDTLDDSMYQMLDRKHQDVGVMLDGRASRLGAMHAGKLGTFQASDDSEEVRRARENPPEPEIKFSLLGQRLLSFRNCSASRDVKDNSEAEESKACSDQTDATCSEKAEGASKRGQQTLSFKNGSKERHPMGGCISANSDGCSSTSLIDPIEPIDVLDADDVIESSQDVHGGTHDGKLGDSHDGAA